MDLGVEAVEWNILGFIDLVSKVSHNGITLILGGVNSGILLWSSDNNYQLVNSPPNKKRMFY